MFFTGQGVFSEHFANRQCSHTVIRPCWVCRENGDYDVKEDTEAGPDPDSNRLLCFQNLPSVSHGKATAGITEEKGTGIDLRCSCKCECVRVCSRMCVWTVCAHMWECTYIHVHECEHVCVHVCEYRHVCTGVCWCMHRYECACIVRVCMHACVWTWACYMHVNVSVHACVWVCMCVSLDTNS